MQAFSLGGKDRHPFPVPLKTYDESIAVPRASLDAAKVGDKEKLDGFRRLERFTRTVEEKYAPQAAFNKTIAYEKTISREFGGRSVFDDIKKKPRTHKSKQLSLF
jgi:uncharacterized protein